ncbi:MAG: hypothetical protein GY838_03825 [bacterium]|nr:hypothetical protein [bacterium]
MHPSQLRELTLGSLKDLDGGKPELLFAKQLAAVIFDCENRPNLNKAREINVKLKLTPVYDEELRVCDDVKVQFVFPGAKIPEKKSGEYTMAIRTGPNGKVLGFNPDALDDPHANTLFAADDDDNQAE